MISLKTIITAIALLKKMVMMIETILQTATSGIQLDQTCLAEVCFFTHGRVGAGMLPKS